MDDDWNIIDDIQVSGCGQCGQHHWSGLVTPAPRETHYSAVCGDTGLGRDAAATDDNICYHWDISTSLMMPWPGNNSTKYGQIN